MDKKTFKFTAEIKKVPDIDGAYVEIPFDVKETFGKGRVPVVATFDGEIYEGQLVKMKTPCHIIGVRKEIRAKINKQFGDMIEVTITERETETEKEKVKNSNEPKEQMFNSVDEYISFYANDKLVYERLKELRAIILSCSDELSEKISYSMPCFVSNGIVVYFGAFKNHIGFYPTPSGIINFEEKFKELGLKFSKGAVQFSNKKELPIELIKEIVIFRINENNK